MKHIKCTYYSMLYVGVMCDAQIQDAEPSQIQYNLISSSGSYNQNVQLKDLRDVEEIDIKPVEEVSDVFRPWHIQQVEVPRQSLLGSIGCKPKSIMIDFGDDTK